MKSFMIKPTVYFDCSYTELHSFTYDNVFVICDPFFFENKVCEKILSSMTIKNTVKVFSEVKPDPTTFDVSSALTLLKEGNYDTIIAIGGGSAIDLAKGVLYFANQIENSKLKLVAIPTTSGTGSEVTSFTVISDDDTKRKVPIVDELIIPDVAILITELVYDLPKHIIAHTGMDVLTHSIEAFVSLNANCYSDAFAVESIKLVSRNLLDSYMKVNNQVSKSNMHHASTLAGLAFNEASLGLNHAIAHQLGARFKVPHGLCNAILMPYVIKYNSVDTKSKELYNEISKFLGLSECGSVNTLIRFVNMLNRKMGIQKSFLEFGINKDEFFNEIETMALNALEDGCYNTNRRKYDVSQVMNLLSEAYYGR